MTSDISSNQSEHKTKKSKKKKNKSAEHAEELDKSVDSGNTQCVLGEIFVGNEPNLEEKPIVENDSIDHRPANTPDTLSSQSKHKKKKNKKNKKMNERLNNHVESGNIKNILADLFVKKEPNVKQEMPMFEHDSIDHRPTNTSDTLPSQPKHKKKKNKENKKMNEGLINHVESGNIKNIIADLFVKKEPNVQPKTKEQSNRQPGKIMRINIYMY